MKCFRLHQYHKNETPSLTDYILVSQDKFLVEHFAKQVDGRWLYHSFNQAEDALRIGSIEAEVALRDIYLRVEFPPEDVLEEEQIS